MRNLFHQINFFVAIGCLASLVHWGVAVCCVQTWQADPLAANIVGWVAAFFVSFSGHHRVTFRHAAITWTLAARRFFLVSGAGIAINQVVYAYLLRSTAMAYDILLALTLAGVAMVTFILSRLWAFRDESSA